MDDTARPTPPTLPVDPVSPASSEPPWHAPTLPPEPEPVKPEEPPKVELPPIPSEPPPVPAREMPSFPPPPPKKPSAGKAIAFVLIFFILAIGGVFGYLTVQQGGLPFNLGKKAAGTCPPDSFTCVYDGEICHTCACNPHTNKGARKVYSCVNGGPQYNFQDDSSCEAQLQGQCGSSDPCANHVGENICEGQSNNDGSVSVRNCSNETRSYTCQKESDRFTSVSACQTPVRTTQGNISYSGMEVGPGGVGTCSTDAGGSCNLGQADILPQGSSAGICWDIKRDCSNCGGPAEPCCTNLTLAKVLPDGTVGPLTDLAVGDKIRMTLTFSGTVEDAAVRIKKGGVKLTDKLAGGSKVNTWSSDFTISAAGEYEILGFVKVGGNWK